MTKAQKWLLACGGGIVIAAEIVKRVPMSKSATLITGILEVVAAIATGIAFAITATIKQ